MNLKKTIKFIKKHIFLIAILIAIFFVGFVSLYRVAFSKSYYVYARVKVGQGLWWASTQRPSIYQVESIKKGDTARSLVGSEIASVLSKQYYRYFGGDQFDIYLTLKLKANYNSRTREYTFERSTLSVGSPLRIQFPRAELTGTILQLSNKPIETKLERKTLTLVKKYAYPWEFDAIQVGDKYFDGENNIFVVLDKQLQADNVLSFNSNVAGAAVVEPARYVTIRAEVLLSNRNGQFIFGGDQIVNPGKAFNVSLPSLLLENYFVTKIE